MPNVSRTVELPLSPERVWDVMSDFARFPDWLTIHSRWPEEPPSEIAVGSTLQQEVRMMGTPAQVTWNVSDYERPSVCELSGQGPMGIALKVTFRVESAGDGAKVTLEGDFSGGPLAGPLGESVGKSAGDELAKSLEKLTSILQ